MTPELKHRLEHLRPGQELATNWNDGAMLVLAGPGVGKTMVLTTRIARILDETKNRHFRILALTLTTKAGDEMRNRVERLVPESVDRTVIGTFHSFCARILRQHGSHLNFKPDFTIYEHDGDRKEALAEAIEIAASNGESVNRDDTRWLNTIDQLKSRLNEPTRAADRFRNPAVGKHVARIYSLYERALRQNNAMDFNGLILNACRLVRKVPAVAARIRRSYLFWMIDEFQDTTFAQFELIRLLAGREFQNIFAVADDDQIIYEWAGASSQRIESFKRHYSPELIQLVENHRCPPQVVELANSLISHNSSRIPGKKPLEPARSGSGGIDIQQYSFSTDTEEAAAIAERVSDLPADRRGRTVVLARTRRVLEPVLSELHARGVKCDLPKRRDQFVSPQFVWLQNVLNLSLHPTDLRSFSSLVGAANRIGEPALDAQFISAVATSIGDGFLESWANEASNSCDKTITAMSKLAKRLVESRRSWRDVLSEALEWLPQTVASDGCDSSDVDEDKAAWISASKAITKERKRRPELDELLRGIALRRKDPPLESDTVRLLTIHAAKGLGFENVWVMGLADSILPSWQSLQPGANPAELEEERRNLFVAITRTEKQLVLSTAASYRGVKKRPSRFLAELDSIRKK